MFNYIYLKVKTLAHRLELLRILHKHNSKSNLPPYLFWKVLKNPRQYDSLIIFSLFIEKINKIELIDIGANIGLFSESFEKFFNNIKCIHLFEPHKILNDQIESRVRSNKKIYNCLLAANKHKREFHYNPEQLELSSSYKYNENTNKLYKLNNFQTKKIITNKLDDFYKNLNDDTFKIMKIDAQGMEYEILKGGSKILKSISLIKIECSFTPEFKEQDPSFPKICSILQKSDFYPIHFEFFSNEISYLAFERDVIFVKKNLLNKNFF